MLVYYRQNNVLPRESAVQYISIVLPVVNGDPDMEEIDKVFYWGMNKSVFT